TIRRILDTLSLTLTERSKSPATKSWHAPSRCILPYPLITLPPPSATPFPYTTLFRSTRPPLSMSNSPATVRLLPAVKSTKPPLSNSLPPTGTFTGDRKSTRLNSSHENRSSDTSHKHKYTTGPLPCKSNALLRLIHLIVP